MLNVGIVQAIFRLDDQFSNALNAIENRLKGFSQFGAKLGNGFAAAGLALTASLTVPMTGLVKITSDFETSFANVVKTVEGLDVDALGNLNVQAASLREEIRGLAREIPITHNELARIASVGGQFGVAVPQLANFTEVVAKLGVAIDGIQPDIAAGALAQIQKIARPQEADAFERMASTLVDLGNKGTSTETVILELTRRISGAASMAGLSTQDMFGLAAATANLGHEAELGGTALSRTFLEISRAIASGGDDLQNFAKVNQQSAKEFAEAWRKDAMGTLQELLLNLGKFDKGNLPSVMAELFGKDVRQSQVLTTLIRDYKGLTQTLNDARTAWKENQALAEESRKKFATFQNQVQLLQNRLTDIGITIGGPFVRALRDAIDRMDPLIMKLDEIAKKFEQLPQSTQTGIVSVGLFASAIGPILATLGGLVWGISQLGITFAALGATLKVGAYVAIAAALAYLVKQYLEATGAIRLATQWGKAFGEMLLDLWNVLGRNMFGAVVETAKNLWEILTSLYNITTILLQPLMELLGHENLLAFATSALKGFVGALVIQFSAWLDVIRAVSETISIALQKLEQFVRYVAQLRNIKLPDIPDRPGAFNTPVSFQSQVASANDAARGGMKKFDEYLAYNTALNMTGAVTGFGNAVAKSMEESGAAMDENARHAEIAAQKSKALSEAQRIAAEQARNLQAAIEAQTNAFLDAFGKDHVERALTLMQVQKDAAKAGLELPLETTRELADEVQAAMGVLAMLKIPIPDEMYRVRDAAQAVSVDLTRLSDVATKTDFKEFSNGLDTAGENLREFLRDVKNANWDKVIEAQTEKSAADILKLGKSWDEAMDKFKNPPPTGVTVAQWKSYGAQIEANYIQKVEKSIEQTDAWRFALMALLPVVPGVLGAIPEAFGDTNFELEKAVKDTFTFDKAVRQLSTAFSELNEISDLSGLMKQIADIVALMAVGTRIGQQLRDVLTKKEIEYDPVTGKQKEVTKFDMSNFAFQNGMGKGMESYIQGFMALAQGYAAMQNATDVAGKKNRVLRGGMTGASIGSAFGPWGTVIGFVVGAIWGAVRKLQWEDIGKRIANRLGIDISEKLMRAIEATAKGLFKGDSHAAEIYHLNDIIKEAGGVTAQNFDKLVGELRDVFVMLSTGMFDAAQASKILNDNWESFLEAGTDNLGFISPKLKEIIALAEQFGVASEKIQQWRIGQAENLLANFNLIGVMPVSFDAYQGIADSIQEAKDALEELNKEQERGAEWAAKHKKAQDALSLALKKQQEAAAGAVGELNDLGLIAVTSVMAAVASGLSLGEAIAKAGTGLDSLIKAYENLGIAAEDPLVQIILRQREVYNAIPQVMEGVAGLGGTIVGLTNLNLLNADSFAAIQRTAFRAYTTIQGEVARTGGSTRDALLPMQTYLQQAERAARELGIPLDENTQMMIDQSKELGIWKELGPTAAEQTQTAINNLTSAIDRLTRALLGIPDEIPDPTRNWGDPGNRITYPEDPNGPNPRPPGTPGGPPSGKQPDPTPEEPARAVGSMGATGNWFEQWDPASPVRLHGMEAVIRPDQAPAFAADVMKAQSMDPYRGVMMANQGSGPNYLVLPDGRILAQVVAEELPYELIRQQGMFTLTR